MPWLIDYFGMRTSQDYTASRVAHLSAIQNDHDDEINEVCDVPYVNNWVVISQLYYGLNAGTYSGEDCNFYSHRECQENVKSTLVPALAKINICELQDFIQLIIEGRSLD